MNNKIPLEPTISVIMAVKNGGQVVRQAVESILNQTFTDFEFIIINDGSTDETMEVLSEYKDSRIHIFSQENEGLARSLNRGLSLAVGEYIARQDHDDISSPMRLQKQVAYLREHPECGLLGTAAHIWDLKGTLNRRHDHPTDPATLAFDLIFNNPFVHTSWMFPSTVISNIGYYTIDPDREPPEDYEYVSRINRIYSVANLSEPLVIYREVPNSLSSQLRPNAGIQRKSFSSKLAVISSENIAWFNDLEFDNLNAIFFGRLVHSYFEGANYTASFRVVKSMVLKSVKKIELLYGVKLTKTQVNLKINDLRYQYLISPYISRFDKALALLSPKVAYFVFTNRIHRLLYLLKYGVRRLGFMCKNLIRWFGLLPPKK